MFVHVRVHLSACEIVRSGCVYECVRVCVFVYVRVV